MNENNYFYVEWVFIKSDGDLEEAKNYLNLWKKFLLMKLPSTLEYVSEDWATAPVFGDCPQTLALKIEMKGYLNEETLNG